MTSSNISSNIDKNNTYLYIDETYSNISEFKINQTWLTYTIDFDQHILKGSAVYDCLLIKPNVNFIILDIQDLNIKSVNRVNKFINIIDDTKSLALEFKIYSNLSDINQRHGFINQALIIKIPQDILNKEKIILNIDFETNPQASGLIWPNYKNMIYTCLKFIMGRSMFPCQDTPNSKSKYYLTIKISKKLKVLTSFYQVDTYLDKNTHHFVFNFIQKLPVPSHTLALAIGNFKRYKIINSDLIYIRSIQIWYSEKDYDILRDNLEYMGRLILQYIEKVAVILGPFPYTNYNLLILDKNLPYTCLEHPELDYISISVCYDKLKLSETLAFLIAQKWINKSTPQTWEHVWLNEGLASYISNNIIIVEPPYTDQYIDIRDLDNMNLISGQSLTLKLSKNQLINIPISYIRKLSYKMLCDIKHSYEEHITVLNPNQNFIKINIVLKIIYIWFIFFKDTNFNSFDFMMFCNNNYPFTIDMDLYNILYEETNFLHLCIKPQPFDIFNITLNHYYTWVKISGLLNRPDIDMKDILNINELPIKVDLKELTNFVEKLDNYYEIYDPNFVYHLLYQFNYFLNSDESNKQYILKYIRPISEMLSKSLKCFITDGSKFNLSIYIEFLILSLHTDLHKYIYKVEVFLTKHLIYEIIEPLYITLIKMDLNNPEFNNYCKNYTSYTKINNLLNFKMSNSISQYIFEKLYKSYHPLTINYINNLFQKLYKNKISHINLQIKDSYQNDRDIDGTLL